MTLQIDDLVVGSRQPRSLSVERNGIVALVGANGSGKSSFLRAIAGETPSHGGVTVDGRDIQPWPAYVRARRGVAFVSDERDVFSDLTVQEHFRVFGATRAAVDDVLNVFPQLAELRDAKARTLSGGEQQMLGFSRALVRTPLVLLVDEPGAGLSPKVTAELYVALRVLADRGAAVIVAEQDPRRAARVADVVVSFEGR